MYRWFKENILYSYDAYAVVGGIAVAGMLAAVLVSIMLGY